MIYKLQKSQFFAKKVPLGIGTHALKILKCPLYGLGEKLSNPIDI